MTTSSADFSALHLEDLFNVRPGSRDQLQQAIAKIDPPPQLVAYRRNPAVRRRAVTMFVSGIDYAAKRGSSSAGQIANRIDQVKGGPRRTLSAAQLIDLAIEIARMARTDSSILNPKTGAETIADLKVPAAMNLLMEVAVYWGDNDLSAALRDLLVVYARYVGDIYLLGYCLQTNTKIGPLLAADPWINTVRLGPGASRLRARRGRPPKALSARFASAVSYDLWKHLHDAET